MKSALDHALEYIRRGWSVVPLVAGTKRPECALAPFLSGEQRMTEEAADGWWRDSDRGVAIITGRPSGIVVIDVDPRNGGDAARTYADTACIAITGGGGRHFICRYPEELDHIPCGKTIEPGVDRKGDGGYIVAPPSIHPSGEPYRWEAYGDLGELPDWVIRRHASVSESSSEPNEPWLAETLANPRTCMPGEQEDTLSRLCWWAARKLPRDIAQAVLTTWVSSLPLGNPHDPWTAEHVSEKLDRAFEKKAALPYDGEVTIVGKQEAVAPRAGTEAEYEGARAEFTPVCDLEFPEQLWVVEDFAAPGAFTEIIGKVKKGKSTLVYQMIDCVRRGSPFLGRETHKTGVIVLTEQVGTSLKKTLERAGLLGASEVRVLRKANIKKLGGWERAVWAATCMCIREGFGMLVVDTLSRLAGLGGDRENQAGAVSILDAFEAARDAGVACVFVRHARKGMSGETDEIADVARGSSAITGDMDIVVRVTSTSSGDYRQVSWESRITDDPEDIYLEYQNGKYVVIDKPASKREQKHESDEEVVKKALAELKAEGKEPNPNAVASRLGWTWKKANNAMMRLARSENGGLPAKHDPKIKRPEKADE